MEDSPEQLSLPLFDSDPVGGRRQSPRAEDARRRQRRDVVSSRPKAPRVEECANDEPPAASTMPVLLTTQEAAELLHVHPRTIQRLVERGQLSAVHVGTAIRFDPADLADLTGRLKRRASGLTPSPADVVPRRAAGISFAARLRSKQDEHRAA
jgi:excisionase family DNA binding protein